MSRTKFWKTWYNWMGISIVIPDNIQAHYWSHWSLCFGKIARKAWSVVWVETLWSLWTMRNHMLFKGGVLSFEEILDNLRLKIMVVVTIQA